MRHENTRRKNSHLRQAHFKKTNKKTLTQIKFRFPGSSSFPEPLCVRACVRMRPPTLLLCSLICVRVLTQLEVGSTIVRGIQRGENRGRSDASTSRRCGGRRKTRRRRRVCKGLGTGGVGGAGFGFLNGRYAQPIMSVGMHLAFWIPSRIET